MLTINFSPKRVNGALTAAWSDPVLTINGIGYDLSLLGDGDTAKHSVLLAASRVGDDYTVKLQLPHGPKAPYSTRFPEPAVMLTNGPITIPPWGER